MLRGVKFAQKGNNSVLHGMGDGKEQKIEYKFYYNTSVKG
jgi:hypothetical protein